jgi:predicted DNA-binding transcriptional regulator AlpA
VDSRLISIDDVAARWGVHRATVLRIYYRGELPAVSVGTGAKRSTLRFRLATIEAFEKQRERSAKGPAKRRGPARAGHWGNECKRR